MEIQIGYVYHIKDEYYQRIGEPRLMQNKGPGHSRPVVVCQVDRDDPRIYWCVPISTQVDSYRDRLLRDNEVYSRSLRFVIGKWLGQERTFLLNNLFPVSEDDIDHQHLVEQQKPARVHYKIMDQLCTRAKSIFEITARGKKVIATDICLLRKNLLAQIGELASVISPAAARPEADQHAALPKPSAVSASYTPNDQAPITLQLAPHEAAELSRIIYAEMQHQIETLSVLMKLGQSAPNLVAGISDTIANLDGICSKISKAREPGHRSLEEYLAEVKAKAERQKLCRSVERGER